MNAGLDASAEEMSEARGRPQKFAGFVVHFFDLQIGQKWTCLDCAAAGACSQGLFSLKRSLCSGLLLSGFSYLCACGEPSVQEGVSVFC